MTLLAVPQPSKPGCWIASHILPRLRQGDSNYVAFFNRLRDLVVGEFFSSAEGAKALPYLGNMVVPEWKGCPPDVLAQIEQNNKAKDVELSLSGEGQTTRS